MISELKATTKIIISCIAFMTKKGERDSVFSRIVREIMESIRKDRAFCSIRKGTGEIAALRSSSVIIDDKRAQTKRK